MAAPVLRKLSAFAAMPLIEQGNQLATVWRRCWTQLYYRPQFAAIGRRTTIFRPGLLTGVRFISIGSGTIIRYGARLEVVTHGQAWRPALTIGDHVNIEQNVHIVCHDRITIGNGVSITGQCAIVDVTHPHAIALHGGKVGDAIDPARSFVEIGDGTFVGFGSTILPNVRIGRNCYIGAGSVVSRDIPDGAVVAGAPARVLSLLSRDAL